MRWVAPLNSRGMTATRPYDGWLVRSLPQALEGADRFVGAECDGCWASASRGQGKQLPAMQGPTLVLEPRALARRTVVVSRLRPERGLGFGA